jgi:hypothetical protein
MTAMSKGTKMAIMFGAIGVAVGIGITLFVVNNQTEGVVFQRAVDEGDAPWNDPLFFKNYQETIRMSSAYHSKYAVGEQAKFTAGVIGGTEPYQFEWKFSDDMIFRGEKVTRSFDTPGKYSALINAQDAKGAKSSITIRFEVVPESQAIRDEPEQ